MNKILLGAMLFVSILYSDNNIIILEGNKDSKVTDMLIRGNGERCYVAVDNSKRTLLETTCLQLTNSKKIKILCTGKKKICKTLNELHEVLNNVSSLKNNGFTLESLRQGMNYSQVREIILNAGWQATYKRWQDVPEYGRVKDIYYTNGWTEVDDCSGTGLGFCRFEFRDINQNTLVVITVGDCLNDKEEICDLSVSQWFLE